MKTWKCPHCKKIEISEDDIVMFLCPDCKDCNMDEFKEDGFKLQNIKPKDFIDFEGEQVCMRCGKAPAIKKDIFCAKCISDREDIDNSLKAISRIKAERNIIEKKPVDLTELWEKGKKELTDL